MDETSKPSSAKPIGLSRREFARRAALASALATVAPAAALTAPSPQPNELAPVAEADRRGPLSDPSSKVAPPEQQPPEMAKLSPESRAEVEARIQTILTQYGTRFSEAQKSDLRRLCALAQPPLDRLRAYALDNGDAPALYLKPLVEREKNPLENTRVGKTPEASENP
jgi:hypothetical protein